MTELFVDDSRVQWAVDGRPATADVALDALGSRPLLLLMHGFGSHEGDLIGLAGHLPAGFVCASPRAPLTAPPPIVGGFSWWPLEIGPNGLPVRQTDPPEFVGTAPHASAEAVLAWLDALDARLRERGSATGLGTVVPMGFSQGGAQVTSLLRLRPERFACAVNCSGFLAPGQHDADTVLASVHPPMFWGRDEADPIIDRDRIEKLSAWAPAHTALEARLYDGIAHGIGLEELQDISVFLEHHVPELGGAR